MENRVLTFLSDDIKQSNHTSSAEEKKHLRWTERLKGIGILGVTLTMLVFLVLIAVEKLGPSSAVLWLKQDDRLIALTFALTVALFLFYLILTLSAIPDTLTNLKRSWTYPGLKQMQSLIIEHEKAYKLIIRLDSFSKCEIEEAKRFLGFQLKRDSKIDDRIFGWISRVGITPAIVLAYFSQGSISKYFLDGPSIMTFAVMFYVTFLAISLFTKIDSSRLERYAFLLDEAIRRKPNQSLETISTNGPISA